MDTTQNIINWFEIYVDDIARAQKFYEAIFDIKMHAVDLGGLKMSFFAGQNMSGNITGALVQHPGRKPANGGVLAYFNANPNLDTVLSKIEPAGGKVVRAKTQISPQFGYMAYFTDTEGNGMALHSQG